jgi:hypothetical protein
MMDGDGCITFINDPNRTNPYGISFVSANRNCVEQIKKIWDLPIHHKISENNGAFIV